jgi:peroxiredoxin
MKHLLTPLLGLALASSLSADDVKVTPLAIGASAPDFRLQGIDDKVHELSDYAKADLLLVAFMSNHCPTSQAVEGRLKKLVREYRNKGLTVVAINPNNPDGLRPDELGYSKYNDGFEDMKKHAKEQDFNFDYLYDGETQTVAKAFGCLATPHVFIFDKERKLRYQGRLDDSRYADADTVKSPDARNAIEALLEGKEVAVPTTKPHGCSTKWLEKKSLVAEDNLKWEKGDVSVEGIDVAGVIKLRKNGTSKHRLFNVWATWCAPCVEEFPELVKTSRKFGLRDFELITISMDDPNRAAAVKTFLDDKNAILPAKLKKSLEQEGRTTNHYIFTGSDADELIKALDERWRGPVPYTVLVGPDGDVIKRWHEPITDGEELREDILRVMGRFYVPEGEEAGAKKDTDPNAVMGRAITHFMEGKIDASVKLFARVVELAPEAEPQLWQRGIALYYANQYKEGRAQFEVHQTANSQDVENAAWHFLCVARLEGVEAARKHLIDITGDGRVPMKEVQQLYAGKGSEEEVLKAASQGGEKQRRNQLCYAHLYLGLYYEALGEEDKAKEHILKAANDYAMQHYMGEVARVHAKVRKWQ